MWHRNYRDKFVSTEMFVSIGSDRSPYCIPHHVIIIDRPISEFGWQNSIISVNCILIINGEIGSVINRTNTNVHVCFVVHVSRVWSEMSPRPSLINIFFSHICRDACVEPLWPIYPPPPLACCLQTLAWTIDDQERWPLINMHQHVNTLKPRQNGRHFAGDSFKWIFLNENVWI